MTEDRTITKGTPTTLAGVVPLRPFTPRQVFTDTDHDQIQDVIREHLYYNGQPVTVLHAGAFIDLVAIALTAVTREPSSVQIAECRSMVASMFVDIINHWESHD